MHDCSVHHEHQVDVEALFREHGLHCTAQRKLVWELFAAHPQGYTIAEAATALKAQGIGQATVYRTVELLARLNLLVQLQDDQHRSRYVAVCLDHAHALVCRGCHAVVEFSDCDLSILEKLLGVQTGYRIDGHSLVMYGTCPQCATARK